MTDPPERPGPEPRDREESGEGGEGEQAPGEGQLTDEEQAPREPDRPPRRRRPRAQQQLQQQQQQQRKQVLLRLDPAMHAALAKWAADELRSTNSQIDYLLRKALTDARRLPGETRPHPRRGRPPRGESEE